MGATFKEHGIDIMQGATGQVKTICPQCSHNREKHPHDQCLSVNIDEGVFSCHHCGWSGSVHTREARQPTKEYSRPDWKPANGLPEKVIEYFKGRGISQVTLKRNDIQYKEDVWFPAGNTGAICFPFKRDGKTVNIKYRSADKQFRQVKGAEKILYGLDNIDSTLIICEGEMDKLSFDEIGYSFSVSVPDGAPSPGTKNYDSKFSFLNTCSVELEKVKEFIIAVDSDPAGQTLEIELARRLGFEKCLRVTYPDGCKDANDVLVKHGKDALKAVIGDAKPFPIAGVITTSELSIDLHDLYHNGYGSLFNTGWTSLDKLYKVRQGEMNIVTGYPGHGKSEFIDAMLLNIAKQYGWQFGVCSLENLPYTRHVAKYAQKYVGKPFFDGPTKRMSEDELIEAEKFIGDHFHFILPEVVTLDNILDLAKSLIYRNGIRGLVIDPYNMITNERKNGISETEYIAQFLSKARLFARNNNIALWIVAHPSKPAKEFQKTPPTVYDISGSAHWANMADNAISVFRNDAENTEIHIKKIRFQEVGTIGSAELSYNPTSGEYKEMF